MIREFKIEDTNALLEIWYKASLKATPFLSEEFYEQERKNIVEIYIPNTKSWVIEEKAKVVGFIAMIGNEVGAIFVYPSFHGKGFGKRLMDHVAGLYDYLELDVFEDNSIGRNFYNRYGFKEISRSVHDKTGCNLIRLKFEN